MNIKNVFGNGDRVGIMAERERSCSAYDSKAILNQTHAYLNAIVSSPLKTDRFIYSDFHLEELQPTGTQLLQQQG